MSDDAPCDIGASGVPAPAILGGKGLQSARDGFSNVSASKFALQHWIQAAAMALVHAGQIGASSHVRRTPYGEGGGRCGRVRLGMLPVNVYQPPY